MLFNHIDPATILNIAGFNNPLCKIDIKKTGDTFLITETGTQNCICSLLKPFLYELQNITEISPCFREERKSDLSVSLGISERRRKTSRKFLIKKYILTIYGLSEQ